MRTRSRTFSLHTAVEGSKFNFRTQFKDYKKTATILVGPDRTPFLFHKDLLCQHSAFFAAALNGNFAEGASQTVTLPDVDPKYFEHVCLWMYAERLEDEDFFYKDGKPTYFTLLDLYALADRLALEGMTNALADRVASLAQKTNSVPTPSDTCILYETIRATAPLRALVLDLFVYKRTENLVATHPDPWHQAFLRDLVCRLKQPGRESLRRHDFRYEPDGAGGAGDGGAGAGVMSVVGAGGRRVRARVGRCEFCRLRTSDYLVCSGCGTVVCRGCVQDSESTECRSKERDKEKERGQRCKPWLRSMCPYHEHEETERCWDGEASS